MYKAPSANEILRDLRRSVKAEVQGTDPWIWPNNLVPVLKALAQAKRSQYLRLEYLHEQAFTITADGDYLDWHGIQAGGLSRNPPSFASGMVVADAVLGTVIPDGTILTRADTQQYIVLGTTTAVVTPVSVYVAAVSEGEIGNTDPGATLTPVTPISGIVDFEVDDDGIIGGAEAEDDDSFRQRILYRKQNPPSGGSPSEYMEWGQTKVGVTRVFVKRAIPQRGSVTIYFMMDGIGNGVPTVDDVAEMLSILQVLAPSDAEVIVAAPTLQPVDVTVNGLVPDTPAIRDAVTAELQAMFLRRSEPAVTGASFTFSRSWLSEATSMAAGWRRSRITVPADDVVVTTNGALATLGTVTFT